MHTIYLDNNATTRPCDEAVAAATDALTACWHNPSSMHRPGQAARAKVELARQSVARLVGARPNEIVFTSGAAESLRLAIVGLLRSRGRGGRNVVVTSPIEHTAIRELLEALEREGACDVRQARVGRDGVIDHANIGELLDENVALVVMQWANNETGAIQPVRAIGAACREAGVPFLCDGAQVVGKLPVNVKESSVDLLACSAHKFHGPKGAGALWIRKGVRFPPVAPGAQEQGRRGGTENVPGIAGMGAAADVALRWLADDSNRTRVAQLRDDFEQAVLERCLGAVVNGPMAPSDRLWNTANIGFPRLEAEALLILLSEKGVCASAGAACSSGSLDPSPVLLAMGVPEAIAHGSLRFSLSRWTTREEVERAVDIVAASATQLSASLPTPIATVR